LIPPTIERGLADPEGLDDLSDAATGSEQGVGLPEFVHDLFRVVSGSLHLRESPGPNRGPSGLSWQMDQILGGRSASGEP